MTTLIKYEAARHALAQAHRVDEVKDIRDKAAAMQVYAMQAKDSELIEMATDIKLRAERRAGELLREMPKNKGTRGTGDANVGKSTGARDARGPVDSTPTLSALGITYDESSRWQKLAAMPEKQFEEKVTGVKSAMRAKTEGGRPKGGAKSSGAKSSGGKSAGRKGTAPPRNKTVPEEDRHKLASEILDHGKTLEQAARDAGVSVQIAKTSVAHEQGRRAAEPTITPDMLSMSAQEKLDAAIRQHKRKLDLEFRPRVQEEYRKAMNEMGLPHLKKLVDEGRALYDRRKAIMDKVKFNKVRRALHPDSRNSISDKVLADAFDTFMGLEKYLLNEKDSPTTFPDLPSSMEEWDKMRRKPRRATGPSAVTPR